MDGTNKGTTPKPTPASEEPKVEQPAPQPKADEPMAQAPEPVMTASGPTPAMETVAATANKNSSWKLIVCIILLIAFVGLVIYYWSTGGF